MIVDYNMTIKTLFFNYTVEKKNTLANLLGSRHCSKKILLNLTYNEEGSFLPDVEHLQYA